jgi:hypothetical protein
LADPRLRIVRDPVGRGTAPEEKVVEYRIRAEQVRRAAEPAT